MTFPFESLTDERRALGLALAVVLGTAFGFVLERSGLGRAQKLVGQFYGTDMTVLKVMFTAIVTTMAGLFLLAHPVAVVAGPAAAVPAATGIGAGRRRAQARAVEVRRQLRHRLGPQLPGPCRPGAHRRGRHAPIDDAAGRPDPARPRPPRRHG